MKKILGLLLLVPALLSGQQARQMPRATTGFGDSSLVVTSDTLTNKVTFVTKAVSLAQVRKSLSKFAFDSVLSSGAIRVNGGSFSTGSIYRDATNGLQIGGYPGATNDWIIYSGAGGAVMRGPTGGGLNVVFGGAVSGITTLNMSGAFGGATTGNFTGILSVGNHAASTNGEIDLDGATTNGFGPLIIMRSGGVNKAYIGTDNAINSGGSNDLDLYSVSNNVRIYGSATLAATFSSSGLTVTNVIRNDGLASGFGMGGPANVQRVVWDATDEFSFVNAGNAYAKINAGIGTFNGAVRAYTDNGFDLGASGANRFRNLYLGTDAYTQAGALSALGPIHTNQASQAVLDYNTVARVSGFGINASTLGSVEMDVVKSDGSSRTVVGTFSSTGLTMNTLAISGVSTMDATGASNGFVVGSISGKGRITYGNIASSFEFVNAANSYANVYTGLLLPQGIVDISNASAGQIKFPSTQVASSNANTLDDYAEGNWTPAIGGTATYGSQVGRYIKVGKKVCVWGNLQITARGTGSTGTVSGLPYASSTGMFQMMPIGYFQTSAATTAFMSASIASGASAFTFIGQAAIDGSAESISPIQDGFITYFSGCYEAAA